MSITEISIKRPSLIIVIFIVFGVLGIFSYFQLKYELLPNIVPPHVTIATVYPGASPQEIENTVTKTIEDAISNVDKIKHVSSYSSEGLSLIMIEFLQTANADFAVQDVQRRVNEVLTVFPKDVKSPVISKFSLSELPILRMGVTSGLTGRDFYNFMKDTVKPRISKIKGVGQVVLIGGDEREIKVNLNLDKLNSYNMSILQVMQIIKNSNFDFPAGKINDTDGQFIVRVAGKINTLEELKNLIITRTQGQSNVRLMDIADVEDGLKDKTTISRIDGKNAIGVIMQKQSGTNSVEVSRLVREEIKKIENDYKDKKIKFDIAQDSSVFTIRSAKAVSEDLMLSIILVGLVMLVFLHSIRNSLIIMVAIPCSLITTFIGIYAFNFTLNLMTLLALSLVIGILVDDSIVVLENIYRHLEMKKDRKTAALDGRNEIGFSALSITFVDVVVFLPLALIQGMIGNIVRQYALVVVLSTLVSLFVSFTITPMLASRFGKIENLKKNRSVLGIFGSWFENGFKKLQNLYLKILSWSLSHKKAVVFSAFGLFILSVALVPLGFIGSEFISSTDTGDLSIQLELPERANLDDTNRLSQEVEKIVFKVPEVVKVFVNVGASSDGFIGQTSNNISEINISLVPKGERKKSADQISRELKTMIGMIPGIKVRVTPIGLFGTSDSFSMGIAVAGLNYDDVLESAKKVEKVMKNTKGTGEVKMTTSVGKPEIKVEIDRERMANLGLSLDIVGATLRTALTGDDESKFREGTSEYNIRILLDKFDRKSTAEVEKIRFTNNNGKQIELRQFADIYSSLGPNQLRRQDREVSIMVLCQSLGRPSGDIGEDIKKGIKGETFPSGISLKDYGDTENQAESFGSLGLALLVAILFVYLIMVALYNSFLYPFVVLFSIPVAIVGALLALALTMKTLNIFSILGIIMLVGLVGKNAILLVDRTNQNKAKGLNVIDAIKEAAKVRLRPIVMTTTSMVCGMTPIAFNFGGASGELKSALGMVLIGGLTSSMFLTLLLVPVVYLVFERIKTGRLKVKPDVTVSAGN